MPTASRTGRIPNTEWPAIVARRQNGETYAAIARDYNVTGPAIKYIVDKAQAEGVGAAETAPEPEAPAKETITLPASGAAEASPSEPVAETPAPVNGREAGDTPTNDAPADEVPAPAAPANDEPAAAADTPLARRLLDAATECTALIARAERGTAGIDEEIKGALHQLRRAVAAIEIELSRNATPARAPLPGRQAAPGRQAPSTGTPRQPAVQAPSNDGGDPGTQMIQGTVKFFHADKGFGFVIPDGGGSDIYVPLKALRGSGLATLESEQRVRVAVTRGAKGPEAKEIEPLAA